MKVGILSAKIKGESVVICVMFKNTTGKERGKAEECGSDFRWSELRKVLMKLLVRPRYKEQRETWVKGSMGSINSKARLCFGWECACGIQEQCEASIHWKVLNRGAA